MTHYLEDDIRAQVGPTYLSSKHFTSSSTSAAVGPLDAGVYRIACTEALWVAVGESSPTAEKDDDSHYVPAGSIFDVIVPDQGYIAHLRHDSDGEGSISRMG